MMASQELELALGRYQAKVDRALAELSEARVMERIWARDHTVWGPDPSEIANRLGWLHAPEAADALLPVLQSITSDVTAAGYTDALLLGMGGSSLGPEVFRNTFGQQPGYLDLSVLDSTDPGAVLSRAESLDLSRTLFIVATKSGGTAETLSFFKYFYSQVTDAVGGAQAGDHFVAITDPGTVLIELGRRFGFRAILINDPNIGGRYSALSNFGLLPATLIGVDVPRLLATARTAVVANGATTAPSGSPAARLGAALGELASAGRDKATFVISRPIASFGDWLEQLIAESTGKLGRGIVPVVGEVLGPPDVFGSDRLFIHIRMADDAMYDQRLAELEAAGHPVLRLHLRDQFDLGGQVFLWEMAVAVAGHRLGINPFDQPDVESAKVQARRMVEAFRASGSLPSSTPAPAAGETLTRFLAQAAPGDYVALQAYLQPTDRTDQALSRLRQHLRDVTHLATTVGYGPRFLHSTGQLHKGDSGRGIFIQLTGRDEIDVPIPDEPGETRSSMTFGVLKAAQALGDRQALLDAGRRVIQLDLGVDALGGIARLAGERA